MVATEDLLICTACGTQFDVPADNPLSGCKICDDPRQFVPPSGQSWTSLRSMRGHYENTITPDPFNPDIWSIVTTPKFGIGERCIFLLTPHGNVLWDLITWLDDTTIDFINSKGGLKAIVISHPHFYTTHLHWAEVFDCPVYISAEDEEWVSREDSKGRRKLIRGEREEIVPGVTAVKLGGHFPGSLVLSWGKELMIADTLLTVPSALYHKDRQPGTTSYAFMWSIPNFIPLPPSELHRMWKALKPVEFEVTRGVFPGTEVRDENLKARVLESMKIQTRAEGYANHEILEESWP